MLDIPQLSLFLNLTSIFRVSVFVYVFVSVLCFYQCFSWYSQFLQKIFIFTQLPCLFDFSVFSNGSEIPSSLLSKVEWMKAQFLCIPRWQAINLCTNLAHPRKSNLSHFDCSDHQVKEVEILNFLWFLSQSKESLFNLKLYWFKYRGKCDKKFRNSWLYVESETQKCNPVLLLVMISLRIVSSHFRTHFGSTFLCIRVKKAAKLKSTLWHHKVAL